MPPPSSPVLQLAFGDRIQMTNSHAVPLLGVVTGGGGLLVSLVHLDANPIVAVLGILGAMALLLASLARLCQDN